MHAFSMKGISASTFAAPRQAPSPPSLDPVLLLVLLLLLALLLLLPPTFLSPALPTLTQHLLLAYFPNPTSAGSN